MNEAADPPRLPPADLQTDLVRVNAQVTAMRAVLVQLLQDIVVADTRLENSQANRLVEANERLVVSALGAQAVAAAAALALGEQSRLSGLDALTGLPNRTVLLDRFDTAILNAKRHGTRVALLFLDLDAFKQINDSLGHASGDRALQLVAECVSALVRETDTVSRHGGDEFLVLLAEVTGPADAEVVAGKVNAALAARSQGAGWQLRASIGISVYPEDGADAKTLIAHADAAMYRAKKRESSGFVFHRAQPLSPQPLTLTDSLQRQTLRDANETLVLAALGAQELLDAANDSRRRQSELLLRMASELSDSFSPVRLAASMVGIEGAEATLLPQVQVAIAEQAATVARKVRQILEQQDPVMQSRQGRVQDS